MQQGVEALAVLGGDGHGPPGRPGGGRDRYPARHHPGRHGKRRGTHWTATSSACGSRSARWRRCGWRSRRALRAGAGRPRSWSRWRWPPNRSARSRCWRRRSGPVGLRPGATAAAGVRRGGAARARRRRLPVGRDSLPGDRQGHRLGARDRRQHSRRRSRLVHLAHRPGPEAPGRCGRPAGDRQRAVGLVASEGNAPVGPVLAHRRPVRARRPRARLGDAARPGAANRLGRAARKRLATGRVAAAARVDRGAHRDRRAAQLLRLLSGDRRCRRPRRSAAARTARRRERRASAVRRSSPA